MAQEAPVVATAETVESSPSPNKRRNRKKGGQRDEHEEQEVVVAVSPIAPFSIVEVATGDLISLPSPVVSVATDVFDTMEHQKMEEQLNDLSLMPQDQQPLQETQPIAVETKAEAPRLDGLLQLSLQQSSGRVPRTPPSTPEPFMVHSPEKGYPRVSPVFSGVQMLSTTSENTVTTESLSAIAEQAEVEEVFDEIWPATESEGTVDADVEQDTLALSSTLADMTLTNADIPSSGLIQAEVSVQVTDEAPNAAPSSQNVLEVASHAADKYAQAAVTIQTPLNDEVVPWALVVEEPVEVPQPPVASNGITSISPLPAKHGTTKSEVTSSAMVEEAQTSKPAMEVLQPDPIGGFSANTPVQTGIEKQVLGLQSGVTNVLSEPSQQLCQNHENRDTPKQELHATSATATINSTSQIPVKTTASASGRNADNMKQDASKASSESELQPRLAKRIGDTSEQDLHAISATASVNSTKSELVKTTAPASRGNVGNLKQDVSKTSSESESQPRHAKRKSDTADVKPPPAPIATVTTKIAGPRHSGVRTHSGSAQNRVGTKPNVKTQYAVLTHSSHGLKNDSMNKPTATSIARAAAAEARRTVAKNSAVKRAPVRKPMTKLSSKPKLQQDPLPNPPSQENTTTPIPAPVTDPGADGESLRNSKRRLNASDVDAVSRRLYEDAKEAKLRKDARRAELQETYTFAPQVNAFKRRSNPGETEEPDQDRFTRLHAQAKALQEKKRGLQQQHERDGCTFTPTISARAKRLSHPNTGPRYENLYKNAQEIKLKREEKLLEKVKTTEEECPFKPKITVSKSKVKTRPLYDSEREKQKRLDLEQKKIEAEMSECTFKPKVSAKRLKSKPEDAPDATTIATTADSNPYNRLYQASIQRAERLEKLRQERDEEEKSQAPFQPKISASRSRLSKDRAKAKQPFHKRLYNKDYMQKVDAAREQRRLEGEQQFKFKPEINEPPEEIKAKVKDRADSPGKNIFERLYDEKDKLKEKIEMGEELRLQKEMAECTFRPQIEVDGVHTGGEAAPPVWKRLLNYDKAQVIEEREKLKEQLEMQECTFKPELKSPDIPLKRNSSNNIFDRLSGTGNTSPVGSSRTNIITKQPSSSPGRQSPDMKGVSIGQIIKSTKFNLPMDSERKTLTRTYSISQPSSVNKHVFKRSTSFSGPKSESSSPTLLAGDSALNGTSSQISGSQDATIALPANGDPSTSQYVLENYESWSATLEAKLRNL